VKDATLVKNLDLQITGTSFHEIYRTSVTKSCLEVGAKLLQAPALGLHQKLLMKWGDGTQNSSIWRAFPSHGAPSFSMRGCNQGQQLTMPASEAVVSRCSYMSIF
jgi:hypothetical protein